MIEKYEFSGEDFKVMMQFGSWKIGFLKYSDRFSEFKQLERHLRTDEAFILLDGMAVLYTENERCEMKKCTLYNIPKGVWHHIVVSRDATVMVVENADTSAENTEKRKIN